MRRNSWPGRRLQKPSPALTTGKSTFIWRRWGKCSCDKGGIRRLLRILKRPRLSPRTARHCGWFTFIRIWRTPMKASAGWTKPAKPNDVPRNCADRQAPDNPGSKRTALSPLSSTVSFHNFLTLAGVSPFPALAGRGQPASKGNRSPLRGTSMITLKDVPIIKQWSDDEIRDQASLYRFVAAAEFGRLQFSSKRPEPNGVARP